MKSGERAHGDDERVSLSLSLSPSLSLSLSLSLSPSPSPSLSLSLSLSLTGTTMGSGGGGEGGGSGRRGPLPQDGQANGGAAARRPATLPAHGGSRESALACARLDLKPGPCSARDSERPRGDSERPCGDSERTEPPERTEPSSEARQAAPRRSRLPPRPVFTTVIDYRAAVLVSHLG